MPIDTCGEFTSRELLAFMAAPVAYFADRYYLLIDVDPQRRLTKTKQLFEIIRRRKLMLQDLGDAWERARDEMQAAGTP